MVRSLLNMSSIPKDFWPEVVTWSIHILKRSPTFVVQNMPPEEAWSGRRPTVDYFKIFGCIAYAHIPNVKRKKLENKGEKCIFLGVSDHSKAYKLYNPKTKKIIVSRDVIFDEDQFWSWNNIVPNKSPIIDTDVDDNDEAWQQTVESSQLVNDQQPLRARTRPAWMADYEVTGIAQDEDPFTYFAFFSDCDPTTFEAAIKESTWHQAINEEIVVIERNNT